MRNTSYRYWMIYVIAIVAAMGGLLFGFDTGVISGAIPFFQKDFGIDDSMVEVVTSSGLLGAILGALCCGKLTDRIGRRKVILTSAVIFAIGALWSGWAPGIYHLIAARLFLGVAIGISSFAVPLYIAEVSPAKSRGMFVAMFQLMITIGLLVSYLSDLYFADETSVSCWRPMFYVGVIPAIILFVGMLLVPPSPRWLMSVGREEESLSVLKMIEHPDQVNVSFEQMRNEMRKNDEQQGRFKDLAQPWLRNALVIAIGIMFFQQFVGINTVIYYSPKIFLMAGFDGAVSAIGASVGVGVVNLLFTLLSVYFVDRLGRRKLYFLGLSGIVISLSLLATSFIFAAQLGDSGKWLSIVLIFLYVGFFAISIGPLGWLIVSEVFPQKLRGLGASLGSLSVWFFNAIVSFTFFKILKVFSIPGTDLTINGESQGNPAGAFLFYAFIGIVAIIWGYFYVPETKGVSLENIEA
ncbi:MAG: sugar porter family MFS transporter, partial [Parabacteroides sp.]|nr:sugar porter family MFS transporter [Parabacteroides sp.]